MTELPIENVHNRSENTKTRNHHHLVVRVFNVLGSARLPNVRTPFLRLRLPVTICRVQRGEAKLVLNVTKIGEYLALAPEDLDRLDSLLPGPPVKKSQAGRMRIDYAALKAQSERLLSDGTCASRADLARHLGVSRVWVSRVLKEIKREAR